MPESPTVARIDRRVCIECKRVFNLYDLEDADEWVYGHDCEA